MKKPAKMAIVTRTKNRNLLLERALQSVAKQTSKDYVHVVLNDGGDKASLERLLKKYPDANRVVVHNDKSVGHTVALNQAIRAADSTYISILDDDDTWSPDRVEVVNAYMDEHKSNGAVVVMDRIIEKIEDGVIVEMSRNPWLEGVRTISLYKQCLDNYLTNNCFNFTRKVYEELNGYDETLRVAEDWDFGIRYLLKYEADFIETDHALADYRHRPEQMGDSGNSVFAAINVHETNVNYLRNKYLRADIAEGKFGVGYIMNDLAYRREKDTEHEQKDIEKVVRLEGHVNYVGDGLVQEFRNTVSHKMVRRIKRTFGR